MPEHFAMEIFVMDIFAMDIFYFLLIYHISTIRKKISSSLYFMRSARNILSKKSLTSIYYSLIHSHLIYGIQVWSSCNNDYINGLFKLQKKAIRIIHSLPYNGHTESYFKKSNILPLPKLICASASNRQIAGE